MAEQKLHEEILRRLNDSSKLNSLDLSKDLSVDHQKIVGAIKSLQSLGDVIKSTQNETKRFDLTKEGQQIVQNGSHEAVIWNAVPEEGIEQSALMKLIGDPNVAKLGFSKAMSQKWIAIDKTLSKPIVKRKVNSIKDEVQELLKRFAKLDIDDVCIYLLILISIAYNCHSGERTEQTRTEETKTNSRSYSQKL